MSEKTHWLQNPNKNYLGHWDLPEGGEMYVTIKSANWEEVTNPIINKAEAKRVIRFNEDIKPMICNQINAQSIVNVTGVKWMEDSAGQKICLIVGKYKDKVSKEDIDCIRVRTKVEITLEDVKALYKEKEILVPESEVEQVTGVINNRKSAMYQRVHDYLTKLK